VALDLGEELDFFDGVEVLLGLDDEIQMAAESFLWVEQSAMAADKACQVDVVAHP
jgi:hypothetical protein